MRIKGLLTAACAALVLTVPDVAVSQPAPPTRPVTGSVQGLDGDWDGLLEAGGGKLRLVLHMRTSPETGTTATLDSPDQGANGIPVSQVTRVGDQITFVVAVVQGRFEGTLGPDGKNIRGHWQQLGSAIPLILTRRAPGAAALPGPQRPQTPTLPFPYREEPVEFAGPKAKEPVRLAGTLTMPTKGKPIATVVLVAGSGPQTRDEDVAGHKIFLVLTDHLTRQGIAVLRFDKRGVGASAGNYAKATTFDFAEDVKAAVAYLRGRADIEKRRIGIVGHSEGGLIAPMVAADDPALAFIVLMAAPGENGFKLLLRQGDLILRAGGASEETIAESNAVRRAIYQAVRDETDPQKREADVRRLIAGSEEARKLGPTLIDAQVRTVTSDWLRLFFRYEPGPTLARVHCPVLAINGALDLQVPPKENLEAIRTALAHNKSVVVRELPGLNHLFQTAKTGSLMEYGQIEETFAPVALGAISDWILATIDSAGGRRDRQ